MQKTQTCAVIAALLAAPAYADGVTYAEFGYTLQNLTVDDFFFDGDDLDVRTYILDGAVDYEIDRFVLSAEINGLTQSGAFNAVDFRSNLASVGYRITPEFMAGAGIEDTTAFGDLNQFQPLDEPTLSFELFGQYVNNVFGVAINHQIFNDVENGFAEEIDASVTSLYGELTVLPGATLDAMAAENSDVDETSYVVSANYDSGPIDARLFVSGRDDIDEKVIGLSGHYEFAGMYRAVASYTTNVDAEFLEADIFSVGLGYQVQENIWLDAGLGRSEFSEVDFDDSFENDTLFVALNFETGTQARLDRKLERAFRNDLQIISGSSFAAAP